MKTDTLLFDQYLGETFLEGDYPLDQWIFTCSKCKQELPRIMFYLSKERKHTSYCKSCHYEFTSKWQDEHREEYNEYQRNYSREYNARPEVRARKAAWWQFRMENDPEYAAKMKEYWSKANRKRYEKQRKEREDGQT